MSTLARALLGLALLLLLPASRAAEADPVNLIFATGLPANMHFVVNVFHPWVDRINAAGAGIVHIELRDGFSLVTPSNSYDRVLDDVVPIAWGLQIYAAGKFPRTALLGIPFTFDNSETGSVALWRLYKSGLLDAEYDQIVPLMLVAFSQAEIHLAKAPPSLDNLDGLKLIGASKELAQVITLLGGTPLSLTSADVYEAMQRHTADGVLTSWPSFPGFKLGEVTFYHIETTLGGAPGMVFMAKKKFDGLPEPVRKILADNSNEAETRAFGKFMVGIDQQVRDQIAASPQHTLVTPTPTQIAAWHTRVAPMLAQWVAATPDGPKVLAAFNRFVDDVKAGR